MHRFIVRAASLANDTVTLDGAHGRQISVVLRMQPGDEITLVAGGTEVIAVLERVDADHVVARIRERGGVTNEPKIALSLGPAAPAARPAPRSRGHPDRDGR
jgi:16S rRNA U1498 N3-methylase RsmE